MHVMAHRVFGPSCFSLDLFSLLFDTLCTPPFLLVVDTGLVICVRLSNLCSQFKNRQLRRLYTVTLDYSVEFLFNIGIIVNFQKVLNIDQLFKVSYSL